MARGRDAGRHNSAYWEVVQARPEVLGRGPGDDGTRKSQRCTNKAPREPVALAEYFAALPLERLRECWVAAVVGALDEIFEAKEDRPAAMARPLLVVAERLHRGNPAGGPR